MKKARYCQDENVSQELYVIKENANGTIDLGDANGTPIVTSCPVSKDLKVGHATLIPEPAQETKPDPKGKK